MLLMLLLGPSREDCTSPEKGWLAKSRRCSCSCRSGRESRGELPTSAAHRLGPMPHLRDTHRLRNVLGNSLSPACRSGYDGIFERSLEGHSSSPALPFPVADHHAFQCPTWKFYLFPCYALMALVTSRSALAFQGTIDFDRDVRPILVSACISCHGVARQEGNYRLDQSRWALGEGSDGKPNILPFRSHESRLIDLVTGVGEGKVMPANGKRLTPFQVATLKRWIDEGASWPTTKSGDSEDGLQWWSLQALDGPPSLMAPSLIPVDAFIRARLTGSTFARPKS